VQQTGSYSRSFTDRELLPVQQTGSYSRSFTDRRGS